MLLTELEVFLPAHLSRFLWIYIPEASKPQFRNDLERKERRGLGLERVAR